MAQKREVSPLGASRFERPYTPPSHSTPTSPTAMPNRKMFNRTTHVNSPSGASTADSVFSERQTTSTAQTSVSTSPIDTMAQFPHKDQTANITRGDHSAAPSMMNVVDADEWFSRFRSDQDLSDTNTDMCPDRATLAAAYNIPIYAADGTAMPFGQLYHPATATHQRQLVVFVRHFYCGACQAYLKALADSVTMSDYFSIPIPTSIIVIGCGSPNLIPFYKAVTGCPFPIFAEPSRQLFKRLGMTLSLNIGSERPEYMKDISPAAWAAGQVATIRKGLKARQMSMAQRKEEMRRLQEVEAEAARIEKEEQEEESVRSKNGGATDTPLALRRRDIIKGGNPLQIGGEFLFEEGEVVWCHRMRNYRNHAEVKVIRKILELDE